MSLLLALRALVAQAALLSAPATLPHLAPLTTHAVVLATPASEVYRLTIADENGATLQRVQLVLEQAPAGTTGYLVSDADAAILEDVRFSDGVLRAAVMTTSGRGTLTFHPFADHPYGVLTIGARAFTVRERGTR